MFIYFGWHAAGPGFEKWFPMITAPSGVAGRNVSGETKHAHVRHWKQHADPARHRRYRNGSDGLDIFSGRHGGSNGRRLRRRWHGRRGAGWQFHHDERLQQPDRQSLGWGRWQRGRRRTAQDGHCPADPRCPAGRGPGQWQPEFRQQQQRHAACRVGSQQGGESTAFSMTYESVTMSATTSAQQAYGGGGATADAGAAGAEAGSQVDVQA